jgi:hypothetical protein
VRHRDPGAMEADGNWLAHLIGNGFVIRHDFLSASEIAETIRALEGATAPDSVRSRGGTYAIRNLLDVVPEVAALANSERIMSMIEPVLGAGALPVRGILFDKTRTANWKIPWHQDLTIAVTARVEVPGFGPWSRKAGVLHVQPPVRILEQMLSVRIHLDACGDSNGPLRVIPGTHRLGRLSSAEIQSRRGSVPATACPARAGDVLLMRPLLIHSSSPSAKPGHRRVVHLDYAAGSLPAGLSWATGTIRQAPVPSDRRTG